MRPSAIALLALLLGACAPQPVPPSVPSGDPHQELIDELRWQARLHELEQRRRWREKHL
jgi:hypothetical protein